MELTVEEQIKFDEDKAELSEKINSLLVEFLKTHWRVSDVAVKIQGAKMTACSPMNIFDVKIYTYPY